MDEMFAKAESEQDEEVRKDIYRELIAYLVDYCPSIPLFHHELVYAWNSQLNATVHDSPCIPTTATSGAGRTKPERYRYDRTLTACGRTR